MELQGDIPVQSPEQADAAASRRALSRSVLAGLVPVLGCLYVLFQAQKRWLVAAGRPWVTDRLLLALACLDTLALACFFLVGSPTDLSKPSPAPSGWIGAQVEPDEGPGIVLGEIAPRSPAEEAGLEPGDRILRVDGAEIGSLEELRAAMARRGKPCRVDVSHAGIESEVTVVPRAWPKPYLALFQKGERSAIGGRQALEGYGPGLAMLLSCLGMWAWGRRRAPGSDRDWAWIAAAFAILLCTSAAIQFILYRACGGWTPAFMLLAACGSMGACLLVGLAALCRPALGSHVPKTAGMGVLYTLAGLSRAHNLALGAAFFIGGRAEGRPRIFDVFASHDLDLASALLLISTGVVLAPLAEEVLFRGLLLPALARAFGPVTAVLLSSLVFALGHAAYGPQTIQIFAFGLVLAWARLRSGGLAAPFLLHALFNVTALVPLLF